MTTAKVCCRPMGSQGSNFLINDHSILYTWEDLFQIESSKCIWGVRNQTEIHTSFWIWLSNSWTYSTTKQSCQKCCHFLTCTPPDHTICKSMSPLRQEDIRIGMDFTHNYQIFHSTQMAVQGDSTNQVL